MNVSKKEHMPNLEIEFNVTQKKHIMFHRLQVVLFLKHGFINDMSVYSQLSANPQILKNNLKKKENQIIVILRI